jgi:hypothetical protein
VVPPVAWAGRAEQAAAYHARVCVLAVALARMASRSIATRAKVYSHPAAEFEISPESMSFLFDLSDALVDLQAVVRSDIEEHEMAIRKLDLTPEIAKEAKLAFHFAGIGCCVSTI